MVWTGSDATGYVPEAAGDGVVSTNGFIKPIEVTAEAEFDGTFIGPLTKNDHAILLAGGATLNGSAAYDITAADTAAVKVNANAGAGNKFDALLDGMAGGDGLLKWIIHKFWFYDEADSAVSRRWMIGPMLTNSQAKNGICCHPGHPTFPTEYLYVEGFTGWAAGTLTSTGPQIRTNITRAPGWHFVEMAYTEITSFHDIRIVIIDNVQVDVTFDTVGSLLPPDSGWFGAQYTGDFTAKPFYWDSFKSFNQAEGRFQGTHIILMPPAQPESLKSVTAFTFTDDEASVDSRGNVQLLYRVSTDGGATFGNLLVAGDTLLTQSFVGKGEDVLQPVLLFANQVSGFAGGQVGLFAGRFNNLSITYSGAQEEQIANTPSDFTEVAA